MPRTVSKARVSPQSQLNGFIARYSPDVAKRAKAALRGMRKRLPGAMLLVYDNYNALAIGFGPNDRASQIVFSIAVYPRWVSLFFAHGVTLPDPEKRLQGTGNKVRHIVLSDVKVLDDPAVKTLMKLALQRSGTALDEGRGSIVIRSISAKQRPRRPAT